MPPHVSAKQLSKAYGRHQVLNAVTAEVAPGEIVGVLGKNGAGKTTLLELILGFTAPTDGVVRVFGHESFDMPHEAKERIGFVPQQEELINQLTAQDQVALIGSFYRKWDCALVTELSKRWEVDLRERVRNMSVGQRQKLSILLALGHHPDLLVLDEPVASLDPIARRQFLEQIIEVASEGCRSVVFSSHIVSDVERLASQIWILKEGALFWSGNLDSLKESVLRVRLYSQSPLPQHLGLAGTLSIERAGHHLTAVVCGWNESQAAQLSATTGATLTVEPLSLEEIFLAMH
jgi:ABC-2 type transport system ATP-binding protein